MNAQVISVGGFVIDKNTGEKLIGCNVVVKNELIGTSTNEYGFFSIRIPDLDSRQIVISYVGYESQIIDIDSLEGGLSEIELEPNLEIPEVAVKRSVPHSLDLASIIVINPKEINRMPSFFGERDILRTLQLKPGVQMGKEGSSGIIVRGGGPDQNLFLVDDVPLYYVQHMGNLLSTFNPDAVNSAYFIKGGFPARYGGRLSSVTDIRLKDGSKNDLKGTWTIGTIAFKGTLEGPLNDKTTFLVSGRRCNLDLFTRVLSLWDSEGKGMAGYTFYDANLKVKHQLNEKNALFLTLFSNKDRVFLRFWDKDTIEDIKFTYKNILDWGNHFASVRLNHLYNEKHISDLSVSYSVFNYFNKVELEAESEERELSYYGLNNGTSIHELLVRYDHSYHHNNTLSFRFGAGYNLHRFRPYNNHTVDSLASGATYMPEIYSYFETSFSPMARIKMNAGLRNTTLWHDGTINSKIEPRISLKGLVIPGILDITVSYSRMSQAVHLVSDNSGGIPVDMWIPVSTYAPTEYSDQVSLGAKWRVSETKDISILIEGFLKKQKNLVELLPGNNIFYVLEKPQESMSNGGTGSIYGVEFSVEKNTGLITGWISYMYIRNFREFKDINQGVRYPYIYEKPHNLYMVLMTKLNENINFSASWQITSGNSFTLPVGKYTVPVIHFMENPMTGEAHIYGPKNSTRLKPYHRMDVSFDFHKKLRKGSRVFNISLYNVYNKQNPFFLFYMNNEAGESTLHQLCLFPILPSISYRYNF